LSAGFSRFMSWKTEADRKDKQRISPLETLTKGMLNKQTLLDLVRSFIVFEQSKSEDPKTRQTVVKTVKKLAACRQFYAVNKAVESTIRLLWHQRQGRRGLAHAGQRQISEHGLFHRQDCLGSAQSDSSCPYGKCGV
jgi:type I site-specific restriction-modification system R (restriction) subunit